MLDNTYAGFARYGYRLWASGTGTALTCESAAMACIQIKPSTNYVINFLDLRGPAGSKGDITADGAGGRLTIKRCSRPVKVTGDKATVTLGPTCKP